MKSWQQYLSFKEQNMVGNEESINPTDTGTDESLAKIVKIAWREHHQTTKAFFNRLSTINPQISEEFEKLKNSKDPQAKGNVPPGVGFNDLDREEVRVAGADQGEGMDEFK